MCAREGQMLFATNEGKETIFVHLYHIVSLQPAIGECLGRLLWHLPVALHDLWPTNQQFSHPSWWERFTRLQIDNPCIRAG